MAFFLLQGDYIKHISIVISNENPLLYQLSNQSDSKSLLVC